MRKLITLVALALFAACAFAAEKPSETLKKIHEFRTSRVKEAQAAKKRVDYAAIEKEAAAKAVEAIKGIDPNSVPVEDALDWAFLFQMAGKDAEVATLGERILKDGTDSDKKFQAAMMVMSVSAKTGNIDRIDQLMRSIQPPNLGSASHLAFSAVYELLPAVAEKDPARALALVETLTTHIPTTYANEAEESDAFYARLTILGSKTNLLQELGRSEDAVAEVEEFKKAQKPDSPIYKKFERQINGLSQQVSMVKKAAPAIAMERGYGTFPGLESLKGKVVLLDFFAHWCGPCIAAFPEMKEMYTDLKDKGLEIVGVTTYYGYYKAENREDKKMPKDTEFGKMKEFIADHSLPWPVVYGERTNFTAYGVTGIPHLTVIDKKGVVRKIKIGYNPAEKAKFRAFIESLLAE